MKRFFLTVICMLNFLFIYAQQSGTMTDIRDGKIYKTITINSQIWLAENLNYKADSSCCHSNDSSNCKKFGRLYTWTMAKNVCPAGWHLPADTEWKQMIESMGGEEMAGKILKADHGWSDSKTDNVKRSGFDALPGGGCREDGVFQGSGFGIGWNANWWTSTAYNSRFAFSEEITWDHDNIEKFACDKGQSHSVRCMKD
jgi:uncharacterized protein (TIGR02145 family)